MIVKKIKYIGILRKNVLIHGVVSILCAAILNNVRCVATAAVAYLSVNTDAEKTRVEKKSVEMGHYFVSIISIVLTVVSVPLIYIANIIAKNTTVGNAFRKNSANTTNVAVNAQNARSKKVGLCASEKN